MTEAVSLLNPLQNSRLKQPAVPNPSHSFSLVLWKTALGMLGYLALATLLSWAGDQLLAAMHISAAGVALSIKMLLYLVGYLSALLWFGRLFSGSDWLPASWGTPTVTGTVCSVLVVLAAAAASAGVVGLLQDGLSLLHLQVAQQQAELPVSAGGMLLYLCSACLLPAVLEESLFRGVLLHQLDQFGHGVAVVLTALFFAAAHGNLYAMLNAFVLGCVLGCLVLATGSLASAMLAHFAHNLVVVLLQMVQPSLAGKTVWWIVVAAAVTLLGIGGLWRLVRDERFHFEPQPAVKRGTARALSHPAVLAVWLYAAITAALSFRLV